VRDRERHCALSPSPAAILLVPRSGRGPRVRQRAAKWVGRVRKARWRGTSSACRHMGSSRRASGDTVSSTPAGIAVLHWTPGARWRNSVQFETMAPRRHEVTYRAPTGLAGNAEARGVPGTHHQRPRAPRTLVRDGQRLTGPRAFARLARGEGAGAERVAFRSDEALWLCSARMPPRPDSSSRQASVTPRERERT
jgi:hypothetical protein